MIDCLCTLNVESKQMAVSNRSEDMRLSKRVEYTSRAFVANEWDIRILKRKAP